MSRSVKIAIVVAVFAALAAVVAVDWRIRHPQEQPDKKGSVAGCVMDALRLIAKLETAGTSPSNVVGRIFYARGKTADDFRLALERLPGHMRHVWMPGSDCWFLVGHLTTNGVPLAKAMDDFAALETARYSIAELFSSYVGTVEEIMPAFSSGLEGEPLPEWFVTKEIPEADWLDVAGIDPDIRGRVLGEMRSMQVVRRELLKGNMAARAAKDRKGEQAACEIWARCALRSPNDSMLLERLERLDRNARGFLAVGKILQAMKCFETIILIQPKNAAAVHNFGMCLQKLGKTEMAEQVLRRAEALAGPPGQPGR